ncbi:hypothetical protein PROFUN_11764 [Planoprotostelium fungivorum]|uniref:HNH nuclease domain-containing protein n=1 Tax=Planoprotostelium fungivorum TaxID=1890364 RepID=A0A2P6N8J3_9EUKA|nr:hypothetical protein PROFUN_11764 [Planoprotostelium fungivorum]
MFLGHYIHRLDSPINELLMEQVLGVNGSDLHLLAAVWSSLNNTKHHIKREYYSAFIYNSPHTQCLLPVNNAPFKEDLIQYWAVETSKKKIQCQVTGQRHPRGQVRASHLLPHSCAISLPLFGLTTDDIDNPRNSLLLCEEIEKAFDRMEDWDNFEIFHNLSEGDLAEREERPAWSQHLDQILLLEKDSDDE